MLRCEQFFFQSSVTWKSEHLSQWTIGVICHTPWTIGRNSTVYAINKSVVYMSAVALIYFSIAGMSSREPYQWYIFTWIVKIWVLKWTKEYMIRRTMGWFAHCYFEVCLSNTFYGIMTEVEKDYVRIYFCLN